MKLNHAYGRRLRYGIGLAAVMLAVLVGVMMITMGASAAGVATHNVSLDDPANESIEVSLHFTASTEATVELTDGSVVYDSTTVSGNTSISPVTASLNPGAADGDTDLSIAIDSPDAANVAVNSTAIVKTVPVTVDDAANETLAVDVEFGGNENATTTIDVTDSTGSELLNDSVSYTANASDETLQTREFTASDGLVEGELTVTVATSPSSAYEAVYIQAGDGSTSGGGLIGGDIAGQNPKVAIVGVLVLVGGGYYAREEGWV
ncbi:hypothetical protein Hrd1104_00070 [Halorhabdus sp. CBA1104]|uniref:hypothetical protein n=1 Tax=Halorhabdus sp. CBA1104 TaxID=1380432 RepID=UPI0012B37003|nr:hypothetical protein [Halorhabdus sp. CBA1104]QGN05841.1 hypothetical protein Hrd1104_00070 [Halorhabdus sp. CBA1104]